MASILCSVLVPSNPFYNVAFVLGVKYPPDLLPLHVAEPLNLAVETDQKHLQQQSGALTLVLDGVLERQCQLNNYIYDASLPITEKTLFAPDLPK